MEQEETLWILVYLAAFVRSGGSDYPKDSADAAVLAFRNTEVFYPHQPPEPWEDEDVPF